VVVGGGIAGVAAAIVMAERGMRVVLVEKERWLGGRAAAFPDRLADGTPFEMERGFHAFFRNYKNLRSLLRRVDGALSFLTPLDDYPLLGPGGSAESFAGLPTLAPLNIIELVRRTETMRFRDLASVDLASARRMLAFDPERTYAELDRTSAKEYLDGLRFPPRARQMLFEVFAHSFFNPEDDYSAAELVGMFHFYFTRNPEGLVFDVMREPFGAAWWTPMRERLVALGVDVRLGVGATRLERGDHGFTVELDGGEAVGSDALVLAVAVPALKALVAASPSITAGRGRSLGEQIASLDVTAAFAVWRLFVDRRARADRAPFAGTAGVGWLDNVSLYERFEGESARWARASGGSVVELHAYGLPPGATEADVRADLERGLYEVYPELRGMRVLEDRFLLSQDCPAFRPGSHALRPEVTTAVPGLFLAGDFVKLPFPSALMERAASSGFLAANAALARHGIEGVPVEHGPIRGILAGLP
jgi:isorenieratene synthase